MDRNDRRRSSKDYSYLYMHAEGAINERRCPIVYSDKYNISFFGVEKCHPFDSGKWGRVFQMLAAEGVVSADSVIEPREARRRDLLLVHTKKYLCSLNYSCRLAAILEIPFVVLFPACLLNRRLLRPMRYQTGGTVLAARLALDCGWAINIGGGFHHASNSRGGGFCVYADVTLAIRLLRENGLIDKAMIVDVDAHQGNGHERDFMDDQRVYILDVFNANIYPHDTQAKKDISRAVPLNSGTSDEPYLYSLGTELESAFHDFPDPDIILYVAGTDSLRGDPLGCLKLSANCIVRRDELVFRRAKQQKVPIMMVTSGGYTRQSAQVIADSILNLSKMGLIQLRK